MEWFNNIVRTVRSWGAPRETNPERISDARQTVGAATGQIMNAYGGRGTVFALNYRDEDYLITNAHVTNNLYSHTTGFIYNGKNYFLISDGEQIAFAEHIAFNPQGGACGTGNSFNTGAPFRDLSILRQTSPAQTRAMIINLSYDPDAWPRIMQQLRTNQPAIASTMNDQTLSAEELQTLTNGFALPPIPVSRDDLRRQRRTDSSYSIGGFRNVDDYVPSRTTARGVGIPNSTIELIFGEDSPIVRGHSGSLLYDVNRRGDIQPLGVVTGVVPCSNEAAAVRFSEVLDGLDIVRARLQASGADLVSFCRAGASGASVWIGAEGVVPTSAPRPTPAPARQCPAH